MSAGPARLRVDVHGSEPLEHVLEDMSFLNYRLADVRISPEVTLAEPDIVWHQDAAKGISYDGRRMTFSGPWPAGPIQKVVVTMLALRMEAVGLHPFHASAVRYRDRTVLFLGGESNHGKSMGQIEACRRGALLVSTETTVIDETGRAVVGSKEPFLKKRTEGTERADKAAPDRGVDEVLRLDADAGRSTPSRATSTSSSSPRSTATSTPSCAEMIPFERQFQTFHSLQNYFLLNELLAPGFPMPMVDTDRAPRGAGRLRASGSPSVPISSSGRPPRRCSWTRWIGCSRPADASRSPTSDRRPRRGRRPARRARARGPPARRRHGPDHPAARRDDPAADRGRRQAASPSSTAGSATTTGGLRDRGPDGR